MGLQFAVLASGSRGNSTLVGDRGAALLIDVGIGPKTLGERLESVGASWSRIAAVALTHTHSDHVDTATFSELARRGIVLHCHDSHRGELAEDAGFQKLEAAGLIRTYDERPFLTLSGLRVEPIPLSHDGGPTFGFRLEASTKPRQRPVSIGYLADSGSWTESMVETLADVDVLGVEFNHDVTMQKSSGRPWVLIERNLGDQGHLSNRQGAELVQAVLARSRSGALRHVVLLHLSEQCNHPELALRAAQDALQATAGQVDVHAARQAPAFPNLWIEPCRGNGRVVELPGTQAPPARRVRPPDPGRASPTLAGLSSEGPEPDLGTARPS
jgi:phosphoribosyl 1,2-cyclic phosphodiesterase